MCYDHIIMKLYLCDFSQHSFSIEKKILSYYKIGLSEERKGSTMFNYSGPVSMLSKFLFLRILIKNSSADFLISQKRLL